MSIYLQKKEHNDAFEFLERLIDFIISENPLSDEYYLFPYFSFITCLSCKSTVGEVISHKKNVVLPVTEQDDSITLENLLHGKCFYSLNEDDERTRCSSGCSGKIRETSILGSAPKLIVVSTTRNTFSTVYCETPVEVPYCIYLDSFIGDFCGSVTYTLVAIIYRYGSCLSTGQFNCILFNRDGTCILFDDTKKCIYETKNVLRYVERQKHTHIAIFVYEKTVSTQFDPADDSLLWLYDSSHLKAVENIYYGNAEIPSAITEREIFNVLKLDRLNGDVIDSFICSLISKQQYLKADAISSILSQILVNMSSTENRSIFLKYVKKMIYLKVRFCLFQ